MARDSLIHTRPPVPSGQEFRRLKDLIIQRTGHFYYRDKDDALWDRVHRRMQDAGISRLSDYLELLDTSATSEGEWIALEAEITIGETYFFRYAEQFTALSLTILPSIIKRNSHSKHMRIWSAGCATGAEPYSVAVLLGRLLGDDIADWKISIVGTDINDKFLQIARQGVFGRWALRSVAPDDRQNLFDQTGPQTWKLNPQFRGMVRFERHNLLTLIDGTSPLQFTEFDLILCRNVLIYLDPTLIPHLIAGFRDRLVNGGWLLLGHAEPNPVFSSILTSIALPGTAAYRRLDEDSLLLETIAPAFLLGGAIGSADDSCDAPVAKPPRNRRMETRATPRSVVIPTVAPVLPDDVINEIKKRSDEADFVRALEICQAALSSNDLEPRLHFYQGLIQRNLSHDAEAEKSFRRALFLDRDFVMAHYHLGLLLLHAKGETAGRRSLTNAASLCRALPKDHMFLDGDGLGPNELIELVRFHLEHQTGSA